MFQIASRLGIHGRFYLLGCLPFRVRDLFKGIAQLLYRLCFMGRGQVGGTCRRCNYVMGTIHRPEHASCRNSERVGDHSRKMTCPPRN